MSEDLFSAHMLDGYELLYKRTDDVLKATAEVGKFFQKLSLVEAEYSRQLLKLTQIAAAKKITIACELGTVKTAWETVTTELTNLANKRSTYSTTLQNELANPIAAFVKEKTNARRKLYQDGTKHTNDMSAQVSLLKKAQVNYINKCKAADSSQQSLQKIKADGAIKQKEINKTRSKALKALELCKQSEREYQKQLEFTNKKQTKLYTKLMPSLLSDFQYFEEDRCNFLKQMLQKFQVKHKEMPQFIDIVNSAIAGAVEQVDTNKDIATFIEQNKTDISPPPLREFEPYESLNPNFSMDFIEPNFHQLSGQQSSGAVPTATSNSSVISLANNQSQTRVAAVVQNEEQSYGLSEQDQQLNPHEKLDKVQAQIEDIREAIKADIKSKKGLEKLVKFYASDPTAQEKAKGELAEQKKKIASLKETRSQLEKEEAKLIAQIEGNEEEDDEEDEEINLDEMPKAKAVYDYEATNDTELSFNEGDILTITDQDQSGWWYAEINGRSGFIPNNFVELIE